jgi:hypothetical protein
MKDSERIIHLRAERYWCKLELTRSDLKPQHRATLENQLKKNSAIIREIEERRHQEYLLALG